MQTGVVTREFSFNGLKLPDPDPKLNPEQVRSMLATLYPDIATASQLQSQGLRRSATNSGTNSFAPLGPRVDSDARETRRRQQQVQKRGG